MTQKELKGVCSSCVSYSLDDEGCVHDVAFTKGCDGNLKAIGLLVEGRPAEEVAHLLSGIVCGRKETSCTAQFAESLKDDLAARQN